VLNAQPGLRVEMALPLEIAPPAAETPAVRPAPRVSGGVAG
jgi:hypothetical protein